jgi:uncharacterized protein YciI
MKTKILLLMIFSSFILSALTVNSQNINPEYDSTLAKALGADDIGMKSYVLVILKTGTNDVKDKAIRDSLFAGHFSNMNRLAEIGKLIVAGPLGNNDKSYRGIFILNVKTIEEAKELIQTDPTVKSNIFDADLFELYGSAALPEYLKSHKKIEKFINP